MGSCSCSAGGVGDGSCTEGASVGDGGCVGSAIVGDSGCTGGAGVGDGVCTEGAGVGDGGSGVVGILLPHITELHGNFTDKVTLPIN